MRAKELVAGLFLGAGVVLIALGLLLHSYASRIETSTWSKTITNYTELLQEAEKLIHEINESNITATYSKLVEQLPSLQQVLRDYQAIYTEAEKHKELLVQAYVMTHSKDYNDTIRQLEELSKNNNTLVTLLLGPLIQRLASYMKQAQPLTEEALHILQVMEKNPPQELRKYIELANNITTAMPPSKLDKTIKEAQKLITRAKQLLNNTSTNQVQEYRQQLESYATASITTGAGLIIASAIIIYSAWRETPEKQKHSRESIGGREASGQ